MMRKIIMNKRIRLSTNKLRRLQLPSSAYEWGILVFLLCYFVAIASAFVLVVIPGDAPIGIMGYDTMGHLTYEPMRLSVANAFEWNIRHPLFRMLCLPFAIVDEFFGIAGVKATWAVFMTATVLLMSLSGLFVFKSLRLLGLSKTISTILLITFCSFAHVIMLGFQVESFVLSLFFGSMMVLLLLNKYHDTITDSLLFVGMAGTTSTNMFKFLFYLLVEEKQCKPLTVRLLKSLPLFCLMLVLTLPSLFLRLANHPRGYLYAITGDSFSFTGSTQSKWHLFTTNFLSEPFLFHYTNGIIHSQDSTNLPVYLYSWYWLPVLLLLLLVIISVIKHFRHDVVKLFCLCFCFDVFMHFVVGYGMEEAQLFSGHWLFFIPVQLGVLIASLGGLLQKIVVATVSICTLFFATLNLYHLVLSL